MTAIEKWYGMKPSIGHLKMFGSVAWEHILENCRNKLDAKSHSYIMMGYFKESESYQLFDPIKK